MNDEWKKGLSYQDVELRIQKHQMNRCHDNISKTKKQIIKDHTLTYFNFLNICLALIVLSTGRWKNLTFMVVIIVNAVIGIYQELKVKALIDQLSIVVVKKAKAIRDGLLQDILVEDIVLDDILYIESGQQIATDCQVIQSAGLEVNESLLTGESDAIIKDKDDILLAGSFVVAGHGYAKVIHVGNDNYTSQIVRQAKKRNNASSEMKRTIEKIIKVLSVVIIPVGIVLFMSQIKAFPNDHATAIVKTVAGVVGMIPEGLVLLTSLSFILGVGKLARKKALIQEMEAIEALARVNVLCLDKTGTLTTGEMEVVTVDFLQNNIDISGIMGAFAYRSTYSNPTQEALKNYFLDPQEFIVEEELPFSSSRKMRALSFGKQGKYVLGAPEFLLEQDDLLLHKVDDYSSKGYRVLLLAMLDDMNVSTREIFGIHPLAFIVMKDCIREDAKKTLSFFAKNDVDVCILSGDHPVTVMKVAQNVDLKFYDRYIDASDLDDDQLKDAVDHYRIFGRIKPEQKQKIIHYLQQKGKVVAMVGDGVNDVLALKDANCGIAMANGSDAAKQVAHIVLLDSSFSSMEAIVSEGRSIIGDIERVSSLYLTKTIYSTALCLIFAAIARSYPFTPLQMSLISGLAIGVPSFLLTLDRSSQVNSQGFLKHIISIALPCALTMIIYMIVISFLGEWMHFNIMMHSTYSYLVAGFISFLVVYIVCLPVDRRRMCVATILVVLFYSILLIMPDFFGIYPLWNLHLIGVVPLCISSIFVMIGLKRLVHFLYKKTHGHRILK